MQDMREQIYFRLIQRILANCCPIPLKALSRKKLSEIEFRRQLVRLYTKIRNQSIINPLPDLSTVRSKAGEIERQLEDEWTKLEFMYISSLNL